MIGKIVLALATVTIFMVNKSAIANTVNISTITDALVQKQKPEKLAAKALYYTENTFTFNNHPEYQKQLNNAKKLILELPNSEAKQNLIRSLSIHIVVD